MLIYLAYESKDIPLKRDPKTVQAILLRMGKPRIRELDRLAKVNKRSRREVVEMLVNEAIIELNKYPDARLLVV